MRDWETGFAVDSSESSPNTAAYHDNRIIHLFQSALGRNPTNDELRESLGFVNAENNSKTALLRWDQLAQVLLMSNEFAFVD